MHILVLDGSGADGRLALVSAVAERPVLLGDLCVPGRGGAERLAGQLRDLVAGAGWTMATIDLIAAIVGPGSFTGLRATLALAHGLSLGSGGRLIGVTTGEALRRTAAEQELRRTAAQQALRHTAGAQAPPIWCVTQARRGRIFLDRDPGGPVGCMLADLPRPERGAESGFVLLAGDASETVAATLAAAGVAAQALGIAHPDPLAIAGVALDRLAGRLPPLVVQPLYVDPPEARPPASGLRPAPA
ncbi:tRNA (adenosine(37)-N6)-threonylcarbamoyltransferase complex dimerization subunit type 1 TsaB [Lichenicoccus sp.]|uniref:tRNA (adenosine(37)-N6)-threonylcarbamoyltransferase complex dimerization subunit type 1 TsaB n=1 Tax=Lichenicoccus sp. TaxID=2781899 RepID=UPI003D0CB042